MSFLQTPQSRKWLVRFGIVVVILVVVAVILIQRNGPSITYRLLHQDTIVSADLWSSTPQMLSAGYGFDGIIGVDGEEAEVRAAGGTWNAITCTKGQTPPRNALTSSATVQNVTTVYNAPVSHADGLPVVFSWPILPGTLNPTDFRVTLNTGEVLTPLAASIYPNYEYNERHVAVIFADFGNRQTSDEEGARYTTRVEVVPDDSPLMLVGPNGPVSAVGLFKESDSTPYESGKGPYLVGAKLNRLTTEGEGGPRFLSSNLPNDGKTLYGEAAQYRLRVFTSGGFSPDGVRGVLPTEFERFFRLHAEDEAGRSMLIMQTDEVYTVKGGSVQVLGLADLGLAESAGGIYDDCYVEDHDNYIDIILSGDEEAMRHITHVEIPAGDGYDAFYNPGGPGNNPTPNTRYTAAGPADLEPVIIALDDPQMVSYGQ